MVYKTEEVQLASHSLSAPSYKVWTRNFEGTNSATLGTAAVQKVVLFNPSDVINLSISWIQFDMLVTAAGNLLYSWVHVGKVPFDQVFFLSSGNFEYAATRFADILSLSVRYFITPKNRYLSRQPLVSAATVATAILSNIEGCQPAKVPASTAVAASTANSQYILQSGAASGTALAIGAGSVGDDAAQRLNVSAANAALGFRWKIFLRDLIPHSMLSVNQNRFFNDQSTLSLFFSPITKLGSTADSVTDPTSTPVNSLVGVEISNLVLKVATEVNTLNIEDARRRYFSAEGDTRLVPYLIEKTDAVGTATQSAVTHYVSRSAGKNILRGYFTIASQTNTGRLAGCLDSTNGLMCTSLQSQIGSRQLQDSYVQIANGDHYNLMSDLIYDSCYNSQRMFTTLWTHCDQLASNSPATEWLEEDTQDSGYPLGSNTEIYTVNYNKAATAGQGYSFLVVQRVLRIKDNMPPTWL